MTRREMLLEQYENALFALLMDEVAEEEGRKAIEENERLKALGEPMISEMARQRCMRIIARKSTQQDMKRYGRMASRVITKVAVVALMAMLLFTTVFASSETFRVKTLNFVIDAFDYRTELSLVQEEGAEVPQATVMQIIVGWLPEGFVLVDEGNDGVSVWHQYESETGAMVSILLIDLKAGSANFDTEAVQMTPIMVQGIDAYLVVDGNIVQVLWRDENSEWLYTVTGKGVDSDTVIKFAENLKIQ